MDFPTIYHFKLVNKNHSHTGEDKKPFAFLHSKGFAVKRYKARLRAVPQQTTPQRRTHTSHQTQHQT